MTEKRRRYDLLVVGEVNPDVVVLGADVSPAFGQAEKLVDGIRLTIGSSSAIFACGASRLGLRTALVGLVGDDPLARYMLGALSDRGVDISHCVIDASVPTGASVIISTGRDRAILTAKGAMSQLRAEQVPRHLLKEARHLHVGSYYLQDGLRPELAVLFGEASVAGMTTSFDPNWDPSGRWDGGIDAVLGESDLVFLNDQEARSIARTGDSLTAGRLLMQRSKSGAAIVVIKQGAEGGMALQGNHVARSAALPIDAVDTTGAGDSFDAGFVYGFLQTWPLQRCLELAVACGSLSTRAGGGTEAQPTLDEAMASLAARA